MKQKAQIDILDLPLIEGDEIKEDVTVAEETPPPEEEKGKTRKHIYLIAAFAIVVIIAVGIAGYIIWFQKSEGKTVAPAATTAGPGQKSSAAVMDDFNVDVKDDKGGTRLLSCGFLLEMGPNEDGKALEGRVEIRSIIFEVLHKRKVSDLIRNDEKKEIKKEITASVNRLLGADKVRETYITKFLLL